MCACRYVGCAGIENVMICTAAAGCVVSDVNVLLPALYIRISGQWIWYTGATRGPRLFNNNLTPGDPVVSWVRQGSTNTRGFDLLPSADGSAGAIISTTTGVVLC